MKPLKSLHTQEDRVPLTDGRRERGRSNHSKIIAAGIALLDKGEYSPSAARVAEVAGVGIRSVFRHFEDMETLYRQLGAEVELKIWPMMLQPLQGATWKEKIVSLAKRRTSIFEIIFHYRIASNLRRFESPYLMHDYQRWLKIESEMINGCVSDAARADSIGLAGLHTVLSFANWKALRQDQKLSAEQARDVILRLLDSALTQFPDS